MIVTFTAPLFLHDEDSSSWHFVAVPADLSEDLRESSGERRGFGSLRVRATVGHTAWATSVFPSKAGPYLLPVKKAVRAAEDLTAGDEVHVRLELVDG